MCLAFLIMLTHVIQQKSASRVEQETEEGEEDDGAAQDAQDLLETINEQKEQNNGRIDDENVISFFREKLNSMPCQNQGFILDGFPKTFEQAKKLFAGRYSAVIKHLLIALQVLFQI